MDRPVGSLAVDPNGVASYQFPITVPPGSGHGNEPQLSLNFSHGAAVNDIMGTRWSIGGLSMIATVSPSTVLNGIPGITGNQTAFRYALDGIELLCTDGVYGVPGSTYMKQVEDGNATIAYLNSDGSFTVTNQFGCRLLYGSTSDSRIEVTSSGSPDTIVEWKLSRAYDSRSNYVQYIYSTTPPAKTPAQLSNTNDSGISYLSCIQYTSNDQIGYTGKMKVNFYYGDRPDMVKATVWGRLTCTTHLLTEISTTVGSADGSTSYPARDYKLAYTTSSATGDSLLTSVTEYGSSGTSLATTSFEYTGLPTHQWGDNLFSQSKTLTSLENTLGAQSLVPINMTGRGYTDLACLQFDSNTSQMNLLYFVGQPTLDHSSPGWTVDWAASQGNPSIYMAGIPSADQASLVVADIDQDGRTDIILAYNSSGSLNISVAKANGAGFDGAIHLPTSQPWAASDRFFAIDVSGSGTADLVQISTATDGTQRLFTFFDINNKLTSGMLGAVSSESYPGGSQLIDWFPLQQQRSNTTSLVQITGNVLSDGFNVVTATIFSAAGNQPFSQNPFSLATTIQLLSYVPDASTQVTVLSVDINGDGVTDLVQCIASYKQDGANWSLELKFQTFLFDGQSDFIAQPAVTYDNVMSGSGGVPTEGAFYVLNLDNSRYPCVTFIYKDDSNNHTAVYSMGSSAGIITQPSASVLTNGADNPNPGSWSVAPADIHGVGKAGLMLHYFDGQTPCNVCPVYNTVDVSDFLSAVTNPLGLRQEFTYTPLTLPGFYDPGSDIEWETYSPGEGEDVHILGNSAYVVQTIRTLNDPEINAFPVAGASKGQSRVQQYSYAGGKLSRSGRGYLGFSEFTELDLTFGTKKVSTYSVSWPTTGKLLRQDIYGSPHGFLLERLKQWPPVNDELYMQWMQSIVTEYESFELVIGQGGPVTVLNSNKAPIWVTRETMTGSSFVQLKDGQGNDLCMFGNDYTYITNSNQKLSEHSYSRDESTGKIVTELWTYTSAAPPVDGIHILPAMSKKTATQQTPLNNSFLAGDLSQDVFMYDQTTGTMSQSAKWCSDASKLAWTQQVFDPFGNQIQEVTPDGLTISTTFDPVYNAFPIKKVSSGAHVNMTEYYAYDPRYGEQFMICSAYGDVKISTRDEFGRPFQTWQTSSDPTDQQPASKAVQLPQCLVMDPQLAARYSQFPVYLTKEQDYSSLISKSGSKFLCRSQTLFNDASTTTSVAAQELVDAEGKVRKFKTQADGLVPVSWQYREYDINGSQILESYATVMPTGQDGADWITDYQFCNTTVFDAVGRPVISVAPPAGHGLPITMLETLHVLGDTQKITNARMPSSYVLNSGDPILETLEYTFSRYNKQVRLLTQTSPQTGLTQSYQYDALGRLIQTTDPGGNLDVRSFNSLGCLTISNNPYNNPTSSDLSGKTPHLPVGQTNVYDMMGRLATQTNAMSQVTNFDYDVKGRLVSRLDCTNMNTNYIYDVPNIGIDKLAIVNFSIVTPLPTSPPTFDAQQLRYNYTYDPSGRLSSETLTLTGGGQNGSFTTAFTYDRQGHLTSKTLPDLSRLQYTWSGSHLANTVLSSPAEGWDVILTYSNFTADGLAQNQTLIGSNQAAVHLSRSTTYDLQQRPSERKMTSASGTLVDFNLLFNGLGQIQTSHETVSNELINYQYTDQRLRNSISNLRGTNSYVYDKSGNLIMNAGWAQTYTKAGNGYSVKLNGFQPYSASFDAAGRMISRQVGSTSTSMTYDCFGKMRTYTSNGNTTTFMSDHTGQTRLKTVSGSTEIYCSSEYSVVLQQGQKLIKRHIFDPSQHVVASVTSQYGASTGTQLDAYMTDHKGTVTHVFDGTGALRRSIAYDDYGMVRSTTSGPSIGTLITANSDSQPCVESKLQDFATGLIDFSGRWYDPCIGRFTTPDLTLERKMIQQLDGANLCAFECNDPINRVDPSGHFNWNLFAAIAIAVVCIAASLLIPGSGLLVAVVAGALMGAGVASLTYGIKNRDNTDAKSFLKGWGVDVAIGAATGAITGAAGEWLAGAQCINSLRGVSSADLALARQAGTEATQFTSRWLIGVGGKALLGAVAGVGQNVADTEALNAVQHTHNSLTVEGLLVAGALGFAGGGGGALLRGGKVFAKTAASAFGTSVSSGLTRALTVSDDAAEAFTITYNLFRAPMFVPGI